MDYWLGHFASNQQASGKQFAHAHFWFSCLSSRITLHRGAYLKDKLSFHFNLKGQFWDYVHRIEHCAQGE